MKEYVLRGAAEKETAERRIGLLTSLLHQAEQKITHISELRQRNLNYALVIFAALFTFIMKFPAELYSAFIAAVLLSIMTVFCMLDRRLHKYIHGWGKTRTEFMVRINAIINDPKADVTYQRYWPEGEKRAELFSLQPTIFYFLVFGGLVHFLFLVVSLAKGG